MVALQPTLAGERVRSPQLFWIRHTHTYTLTHLLLQAKNIEFLFFSLSPSFDPLPVGLAYIIFSCAHLKCFHAEFAEQWTHPWKHASKLNSFPKPASHLNTKGTRTQGSKPTVFQGKKEVPVTGGGPATPLSSGHSLPSRSFACWRWNGSFQWSQISESKRVGRQLHGFLAEQPQQFSRVEHVRVPGLPTRLAGC